MAAKEFGDGMDYHVHLQGKWAQKRRGEKYIVRHDRGSGYMPHCDDFPYINHIEARVAEWLEVYDIRRTREHVLQHLGVARVDLNCLYTELRRFFQKKCIGPVVHGPVADDPVSALEQSQQNLRNRNIPHAAATA